MHKKYKFLLKRKMEQTMNENENDSVNEINCIVAGDSFVGKTNLLLRFVDDKYDDETIYTIGIDTRYKYITLDNKKYKLKLLDTAGQEKFRLMVETYFKQGDCVFLVYEITNRKSFENISNWIEKCKSNASENVLIVLIGNKCDLNEKRQVTTEEGENLAKKYEISFYETSAETGENVQKAFTEFLKNLSVKEIPKEVEEESNLRKKSYRLIKNENENKNEKDRCCCWC